MRVVQDAAKAALGRMGDRAAVVLFAASKGKVSMVAAFSDAVSPTPGWRPPRCTVSRGLLHLTQILMEMTLMSQRLLRSAQTSWLSSCAIAGAKEHKCCQTHSGC